MMGFYFFDIWPSFFVLRDFGLH